MTSNCANSAGSSQLHHHLANIFPFEEANERAHRLAGSCHHCLSRICTFNKSECEYRAEPRKRETVKSVAPPERRVAAIYFLA